MPLFRSEFIRNMLYQVQKVFLLLQIPPHTQYHPISREVLCPSLQISLRETPEREPLFQDSTGSHLVSVRLPGAVICRFRSLGCWQRLPKIMLSAAFESLPLCTSRSNAWGWPGSTANSRLATSSCNSSRLCMCLSCPRICRHSCKANVPSAQHLWPPAVKLQIPKGVAESLRNAVKYLSRQVFQKDIPITCALSPVFLI